jgi:hypothetical protein
LLDAGTARSNLGLDKYLPATAGTITRTSELVSSIALTRPEGTDTVTVNRDGDNLVTDTVSVYDGVTKTTTFTRTSGVITSFNIT